MRILGLLREGKIPSDQRAVLNPAQCQELLKSHPEWEIWLQPSSSRAIADADYATQDAGLPKTLVPVN